MIETAEAIGARVSVARAVLLHFRSDASSFMAGLMARERSAPLDNRVKWAPTQLLHTQTLREET